MTEYGGAERRMAQTVIDTRAIEMSREALTRIERHESEYSRRTHADDQYRREFRTEVHEGMKEISQSINKIHARFNGMYISVIALLVTMVGYLVVQKLGW